MSFAYSITPRSINLLVDGRMRTVDNSHMNYNTISNTLKTFTGDYPPTGMIARLKELLDIKSFIAKITEGRVRIGDTAVFFDDTEVKQIIATRLIELLQGGHDVRPMARFLERLMKNPLPATIEHLYLFLEKNGIPLTSDGCFLAFKKVGPDYRSYHSSPDGTYIDHAIGQKPAMPREQVNPDRQTTCAEGLHFCSFDYLSQYQGRQGHVMVVKIAPEDVVAIPYDYDNAKGRAWTYEVVDEVPAEEVAKFFDGRPLVSTYDGETVWTDGTQGDFEDEYLCDDCGEDNADCSCSDEEDEEDEKEEDFPDDYTNDSPDDTWTDFEKDADNLIAAAPDAPNPVHDEPEPVEAPVSFGDKYTADVIRDTVHNHGQRGAARILDVPRTTIQDWMRKIGWK